MHLSPGAAPPAPRFRPGTVYRLLDDVDVCDLDTSVPLRDDQDLALVPATRGLSIFSALGVARRAELAALLARPQCLSS